jgi:phospholipid/cholesterol/gamma-HCH transport system permease protein
MRKLGGDVFMPDLVAMAICMELGPLMVAMICTGRAGSAFAAEIGTMKVSEEVDALVTMGLEPTRFLIIPKVLALVVAMPLLTIIGDVMGILGGMTVGQLVLNMSPTAYLSRTVQALSFDAVFEGLLKSVVFAVLIAGVGCMRGLQAKNSAQSVGRSTTSAVVSGIFLVIIADTLLTIIFSIYRG